MKRLLTVALGAALCSLTTAATAAPNHIWSSENVSRAFERSDSYTQPRSSTRQGRRAARTTTRRRSGSYRSTRGASRQAARSGKRRANRRNSVASRSFTRYASAGTSRSCLTSAARALLGRIESRFGRVQVVSTCRPGARIAGTGRISRHASGNAVDFNAPRGRKAEIVRWLIANHRSGGTMTYARMGHIHVDIGPRFVSLNSGGARYR